jgi:ribosome modulation factor
MAPQLNKVKSFLDTVLNRLPEADRESVRSLYSQAQDEATGLERQLTEGITRVNQRATEQATWWEQHKHLATGPQPQPQPQPQPIAAGQPVPFDPAPLMVEIDKRIGQTADLLAGQGLTLASLLPTLVAQHSVEFGEVLDAEKLVKDALAANTDVRSFYSQSVAGRRETKAKEKYDADMKAAEERGRRAGLTEAGKSMSPYPSSQQSANTLSGLRVPADDAGKAAQKTQYSLDAAVATAMDVMQRQQATTA